MTAARDQAARAVRTLAAEQAPSPYHDHEAAGARRRLRPALAEARATVPILTELRDAWGPTLREVAELDWGRLGQRGTEQRARDFLSELADPEATVQRFERRAAALTSWELWYGGESKLLGDVLGFIMAPDRLLAGLHALRDQLDAAQAGGRAATGPEAGPPRPAWEPKTRAALHGPERGPARTEFDPRELH